MEWITTAILAVSLAPSTVNAQGCAAWLSPDFWVRAGSVEVMGCADRRVEERDDYGSSPLHLAAGYGFVSAVNALVLRDPDAVNRMDDRGYTPLHYAAELNANPDMISALLALGADVNHQQMDGYTPLMEAVFSNARADVFKVLIEAGANVNAVDHFGTTALSHAAGRRGLMFLRWMIT